MDVVHVLNKAHCSLRTGGVLLETHPEPENPSVEVRLARGRNVPIGHIDASALIANIGAARRNLSQLIAEGRFRPEREVMFDFLAEHASVGAWLAYRQEQESTGKVGEEVIARARALLNEDRGVIVVRERSRALRLARL